MSITVTHNFVSGIADDPAAAAAGEVLPSHWNHTHVVTGEQISLTNDTDFYVATTGSDTTGDGSVAKPWATLAHFMDVMQTILLNGHAATCNIANGSYAGVFLSQSNPASGFINFLGASQAGVIITPFAGNTVFYFGVNINITIDTLTVQGVGINDNGIFGDGSIGNGVNLPPTITVHNVSFKSLANPVLAHEGARISLTGANDLTGNATNVFFIRDSSVYLTSSTLTINGNPAWSVAFANVMDNGILLANLGGSTISGAATGQKFNVLDGGLIKTGTNNLNYLPGSTPGVIGPGGQYDKYPVGAFTDTIYNILPIPPDATLPAYASDLGVNVISDGTQWNINSSYYTAQKDNHDLGAVEFSNRIGYGKSYVTDKVLANVSVGFGSETNPMDGQLRHFLNTFFNTEVLQIYQNGEWETLPANVTLRDNQSAQNHALEHFPLTQAWMRVFSGDSELAGLNGLPLVQGYHADMGAYPVQQQLNGGTF